MVERSRFITLAYIPWACLLFAAPFIVFWLWFEAVPIDVRYVSPHFTDRYVYTREEAEAYKIYKVLGGTTVYRFVEFCIRKPFDGEIRRKWVGEALVWEAPTTATASSGVAGCFERSSPVIVPTSSPSRQFHYHQEIHIRTNPLREDVVPYVPIPLLILSREDDAK